MTLMQITAIQIVNLWLMTLSSLAGEESTAAV
jgi:hypothetical protein